MDIKKYFVQAVKEKASDLYLIGEEVPVLRIDGDLHYLKPVLKDTELRKEIFKLISANQKKEFDEDMELDFAYSLKGERFRINLHIHSQKIGLSARYIPKDIPTLDEIELEDEIRTLIDLKQGLILLTGPTGCGKSTTIAAMIQAINEKYKKHIITLEDPIEFEFKRINSVIEQREIGRDTKTFHTGLKRILRQDPDVIFIGEMRDLETAAVALTAAETGHIVFSTLHTRHAAEAVERIIDMFESSRQNQILTQLAASLRGIISQRILPKKDGGMTVAREIMFNVPAVSNLIRQNRIEQIESVIQTSGKLGMITVEKSIKKLFDQKIISKEVYDEWVFEDQFNRLKKI